MAFSFLKKGKAAHQLLQKVDAEAEARKAASAQQRRFWIPDGNETQITFLDGGLDKEGHLEAVAYWEHNVKLNGRYGNFFACTKDSEPCPICEQGKDFMPALVFAFTIIDHTEWVSKQTGEVHKNERKLFICKRDTLKLLNKLAEKRGGLEGCTFDVSRSGEKSPNVGSLFDFTEKRTIAELSKALKIPQKELKPLDYEEVLVYQPAAELRKQGFGTTGSPLGSGDTSAATVTAGDDFDPDEDL